MELLQLSILFLGIFLIGLSVSFLFFTVGYFLFTKVFDMEFTLKDSLKYFIGLILFKSLVKSI